MTKSPLGLAREALALGRSAWPEYPGRFSRHDFTQPLLFAMLVLKIFLKTDFRGIVAVLAGWPDLQRTLGLRKVPHCSTLCYAQGRLMEEGKFQRLLSAVWDFARQKRLIGSKPEGAIDATGLESRQVSAHFFDRIKDTSASSAKSGPRKTVRPAPPTLSPTLLPRRGERVHTPSRI